MTEFADVVEVVGKVVDGAGVSVIVVGICAASVRALRGTAGPDRYRAFRQDVGRAILLGLEILVAADIIRTVAVEPSLTSVAILAIIVAIRTVLSFSLEVELNGRWPWQEAAGDRAGAREPADRALPAAADQVRGA